MPRSYVIWLGACRRGTRGLWIVAVQIKDEDLFCHTLAGGVRVCH